MNIAIPPEVVALLIEGAISAGEAIAAAVRASGAMSDEDKARILAGLDAAEARVANAVIRPKGAS